MKSKISLAALALSVSVFASLSGSASAQELTENFTGTRLYFSVSDTSLTNFTLRVIGPEEYVAEAYSARTVPSLSLTEFGTLADGLYQYELTAATTTRLARARPEDATANGRLPGTQRGRASTSMSGTFRIVNGQILQSDPAAAER
jgi:hypothetical protein